MAEKPHHDETLSHSLLWDAAISHGEAAELHSRRIDQTDLLAANIGQAGIKLLVLINGGAAATTLAFVGALAGKENGGQTSFIHLLAVAGTLNWFAIGVALAGLAFAVGYLAVYFVVLSLRNFHRSNKAPWIVQSPVSSKYYNVSVAVQVIGTLLALGSLACFIYGVVEVRQRVLQLGQSQPQANSAMPVTAPNSSANNPIPK